MLRPVPNLDAIALGTSVCALDRTSTISYNIDSTISYYLMRVDVQQTTTANLGFLLAKASQRWNALLADAFRRQGYPEVRPAYGSVLFYPSGRRTACR